MKFVKSFTHVNYKIHVKLLSVIICCSPLICCVRDNTKPISASENRIPISENAVDINTASARELEKLPGVGEKTARKIIEHREQFGKFRRAENLLLVDGISDEHFREMRNFIAVE